MKLYEPAPPARKDELANVQDGIAVIVDGDTCPIVVESGMYAYIKNNTHGLAEGLYKNTSDSAFPTSGGTADGTVFEADSTGGLNALNASLHPKYSGTQVSIPEGSNVTLTNPFSGMPMGGYVAFTMMRVVNFTSWIAINSIEIFTSPEGQDGRCIIWINPDDTITYRCGANSYYIVLS